MYLLKGQESFQAISKLFIRGALGCIIVTDITNIESFYSALKWKELVEENCDYFDGKPIPLILVQNKLDLLSEKPNEMEENELTKPDSAKKFAKEHNFITNVQVSAKENINLEKIFKRLVKNIQIRKLINYDTSSNFGDEVGNMSRSKSSILELQKDLMKKKEKESDCYC